MASVVESRAVAADASVVELKLLVVDDELVGDEFLPCARVAWDEAADGVLAAMGVADADGDVRTDSQPLAPQPSMTS